MSFAMEWIMLSPHLDDVALSCGGWIWELTQAGHSVQVWSICAGDPPGEAVSGFAESLHHRWQLDEITPRLGQADEGADDPIHAAEARRREDIASCQAMGAGYRHFPLPDCIYRLGPPETPQAGQHLYDSEESLWLPVHPAEAGLTEWLSRELASLLPSESRVVCPLTLGGHVDHRLTRQAAESLGRRLWFYADYPYALSDQGELAKLERAGWETHLNPVSEAGLQAWVRSVAAHQSQVSTFWHQDAARRIPAEDAMRAAITTYCQAMGGVKVWQPPVG
jgi:LmbE family N-acetylglucosaminyl deacetylase